MNNNNNNNETEQKSTHAHICVKCGRLYVHRHVGEHQEHKQWAYQCPYETCLWFSGDKPATMGREEQKRAALKGWTILELDDMLAAIKKLDHTRALTKKDYDSALAGMDTYSSAKTWIQRQACEYYWSRDQTGSYASKAIQPGSYTLGIKEAGNRTIWQTAICLNENQLKYLTAANPSTWFITGDQHHDHPVSHITTQMATRGLTARLRSKEGAKVLDVHGNPKANKGNTKHSNVRFDTVVEKVLPKDYIRAATKWGDLESDLERDGCEVYQSALRDFTLFPTKEWAQRIGTYTDFMSVHTLYYMQRDEIASLLSKRQGSVLHAIVHKHAGMDGQLANGEQTWYRETVGGVDHIYQENVLTGETYSHPNLDWLFGGASSWHNDETGFGWTLNKLGNETFLATFTGVPVTQCRMDVRSERAKVDRLERPVFSVVVAGNVVTFDNVHEKTAKEMALLVSDKARTAQQFKDHVATTKRKLKANKVDDPAAAHDTAVYSFFLNLESDSSSTRALFDASANGRRAFKRALDGVTHADTMSVLNRCLMTAELVVENHTSWKKLASGGIRMVRETL